jgi:uncharacterized protein (TIGR02145 family)
MNRVKLIFKPIIAVGLIFALAFIISCSSKDDEGEGCVNTEMYYCYNGTGTMKEYGKMTDDGGKIYKTVEIGEQVWMAENLNYNASGSECRNDLEANCAIYGRLYDWDTAMEACPDGWHLPTNLEWDQLYRYVDGTSGEESPYDSPTAGKYLKAKNGWGKGANGTDDYGFSALPGGSNGVYDSFWWTADENYEGYRSSFWSRRMIGNYSSSFYYKDGAYYFSHERDALLSVRCIKTI